jgi:hypothetical protein
LLEGCGQNEAGRQDPSGGPFPSLGDSLIDLAADQRQAREVVFNVAAAAHRVGAAEKIDELHLQSAVLLENEGIVGERVSVHEGLELPLQDGSGNALGGVEGCSALTNSLGNGITRQSGMK